MSTDNIPDSHADRWLRGDPGSADLPRTIAGRRGDDALALAEDAHRTVPARLVDYVAGKLVVLAGDDAATAVAAGVPHRPLSIGSRWCDRTQRARPIVDADRVVTTSSEAVRLRRQAKSCADTTGPVCHPAVAT